MNGDRRSTPRAPGEGTRMLHRIERAESKLPAWVRTALQVIGLMFIAAPVLRFLVQDVIGLGHHEHPAFGAAKEVLYLTGYELAPSAFSMLLGFWLLIPPFFIWCLRFVQYRMPAFFRKKEAA